MSQSKIRNVIYIWWWRSLVVPGSDINILAWHKDIKYPCQNHLVSSCFSERLCRNSPDCWPSSDCRTIQRSQTDLSDPENLRLRAEEERLSLLVCSACCQPFSLLYRRRLVCSCCLLGVCRVCASFSPSTTLWTCRRCQERRWVRRYL